MEIAGEHKEQVNGFAELSMVLLVSVLLIYVALVVQFKHAVKPVLVFAAIPYGKTGAFVSLYLMGAPFGFMGFLGVVSLVGVIVSHIIVLFDFIEERREHGAPSMRDCTVVVSRASRSEQVDCGRGGSPNCVFL